ncbi:hypothetical protein C7B77_11160 [Chamaesiphon polymorphus CCALA 037]|uniref:Uncharacterized protein n=1 Tax=Chamaesiphon polymorphus CCALA 037 TaxID=2107692 RepID=A0A2T1GG62_9CYAN|nr:hypothetical protein C7B77_11160 [Chamaesiphon polymorphus CCALA 037]
MARTVRSFQQKSVVRTHSHHRNNTSKDFKIARNRFTIEIVDRVVVSIDTMPLDWPNANAY